MAKKDIISSTGVVVAVLRDCIFRVKLYKTQRKPIITAKLSGKMYYHHINVVLGDIVRVEMSPHDITKGRIVKRY